MIEINSKILLVDGFRINSIQELKLTEISNFTINKKSIEFTKNSTSKNPITFYIKSGANFAQASPTRFSKIIPKNIFVSDSKKDGKAVIVEP